MNPNGSVSKGPTHDFHMSGGMNVVFDPFETAFLFQTHVSLQMGSPGFAGLSAKHKVLTLLAKKRAYGLLGAWVVQSKHPVPGPGLIVYYYTAFLTLARHMAFICACKFGPHTLVALAPVWVRQATFKAFQHN